MHAVLSTGSYLNEFPSFRLCNLEFKSTDKKLLSMYHAQDIVLFAAI